jgi:ubiquinone/menaquinone biosynthesis C-methylase UbiE
MKLGRKSTQYISYLFDELLPPFLRDSYWFMWPFQWLLFRDKTKHFMNFKRNASGFSASEIREIYQQTACVHIKRETDLNPACVSAIEQAVKGDTVLEAGCGRGYLTKRLSKHYKVTAVDFKLDTSTFLGIQTINLIRCDIENLPFQDNSFDTVVCTHTLEHVFNLAATMSRLRKIARRRLIVVVPLQRPYKYTFDLHVQFFPYPYSFLLQAGPGIGKISANELGGDLFYMEDNP